MSELFKKAKSPIVCTMTSSILTDVCRSTNIVFKDFFDVEYDSTIDGIVVTLKENPELININNNIININEIDTNGSTELYVKIDGQNKINATSTEETLYGTTFVSGTLNATSFAFGRLTNSNFSSNALIDQTKTNSLNEPYVLAGGSSHLYPTYPTNIKSMINESALEILILPSGSANVGVNFRVHSDDGYFATKNLYLARANDNDKINNVKSDAFFDGSYRAIEITCVRAISPANVEWNVSYLPKVE